MSYLAHIQTNAWRFRKKILEMIFKAQTSHIGSNLSCIDILTALYFLVMKDDDRFVLSKGWSASALYVVLAEKGYFDKKLLDTYCHGDSPLISLASAEVDGVEASTGSMGHGLPIAVGMALSKKLTKQKDRVYCLIGDGELDCGTTWESALFAGHHKLNNLTIIIDCNGLQGFGKTKDIIDARPIAKKFKAFGFSAIRIDGHNFDELARMGKRTQKPLVIIAYTIKGRGVSFMENNNDWHYWNIPEDKYKLAIAEVDDEIKRQEAWQNTIYGDQ